MENGTDGILQLDGSQRVSRVPLPNNTVESVKLSNPKTAGRKVHLAGRQEIGNQSTQTNNNIQLLEVEVNKRLEQFDRRTKTYNKTLSFQNRTKEIDTV